MNSEEMNKQNSHLERQLDFYHKSDRKKIQPVASDYVNRHLQTLIETANLTQKDEILEVGAGAGRFTLLLHHKKLNVTATDLSADLLQSLNNNEPNIPTVASDITNLPDKIDQKFDKIVGFFMLHHLYDFNEAFHQLATLIKPGGAAVFCEPNAYYLPFYLQILLSPSMRWDVDKGVVNMRRGVLEKAMKNAGFEHFESKFYGYFPPFIYNSAPGKKVENMLERLPLPETLHAFLTIKARKPM